MLSPAVLFVFMTLAAYRLYRLVGLDVITERPRTWVLKRINSDALEAFVTCSWCAGFWCSLGIVAVTAQVVSVPLPVLQVLAVSTIVGLVGANLDG